jgi:hypothetical protein
VDWRYFSRTTSLAIALGLGLTAAACGKNAVRASEKEFLADRVMLFDHDGQETAADEHVNGNREGSAGGRGTSGGGCGCN